jgi:hypothetical protein
MQLIDEFKFLLYYSAMKRRVTLNLNKILIKILKASFYSPNIFYYFLSYDFRMAIFYFYL